jgi:hypothetical protein
LSQRRTAVNPLSYSSPGPAAAAAVPDRIGSEYKPPASRIGRAMIVNLNKHRKQREHAQGERRVSMFWLPVLPVATNA